MKTDLQHLLAEALSALQGTGLLNAPDPAEIQVERTRDKAHGDFATNVAMTLAKSAGIPPRELAARIVEHIKSSELIIQTSIAGPGFINFFVSEAAFQRVVAEVFAAGATFGRSQAGRGTRLHLEYVSANPTGPLHVGHGRGAAYGAALANVLRAAGFDVHQEYYVNDAGRQMDILGTSTWLRYLELCGEPVPFPKGGYQGHYVIEIAETLRAAEGTALVKPSSTVFAGLTAFRDDAEGYMDALIRRAKELLGEPTYQRVFTAALSSILDDIRRDLGEFGVTYDRWYSERELIDRGAVQRALDSLQATGQLYNADGALWFRSTAFGDEKDRVVVRENGQITYFASDIAYHLEKLERGFAHAINIWGADHHGYVPRIKGALSAAGAAAERLEVLLVQFASLYRGGQKVQMSTRSGEFVTLRELRREVGNDAARFFYVMRKCEQHMDFDIDLAKSESNENPVYYIQYAHARICSVMRQLADKNMIWDRDNGLRHLRLLTESHEKNLARSLSRYPEVVEVAAVNREPHHIAHYLRELANELHVYYNAHQFLVDAKDLRDARLALINATRQVIHNGLGLLGVSAPDKM